ncbi:1,4-alpha-glucan branching protein GlgB [Pelagicoccus sp. SDUM812003]|uniref:1,4-alpha-glucan branching protein GlgB n=1 Tax=Pelagicoccus sp. SDUM812003 TaxID=3041267 RepID=UPI002810CBD0|nr:1,4-alpha-glucan branching protein GlgB [Pelagicoccus sp. SDUM812003]
MHPYNKGNKRGIVVRAFLSGVETCEVVDVSRENGPRYPMTKVDDLGFFETLIEDRDQVFRYRLRSQMRNKEIRQFFDPYSFLPTISDSDLYLFNQGNEHRVYEKLGAHPRVVDGVPGVTLAVWAPNADRVSVVGGFNDWDGRYHPMRSLGVSGVWELFIPGMEKGEVYKFEIRAKNGDVFLKTDPYGSYFDAPPHNASIVFDHNDYQWNDGQWMEARVDRQALDKPMSVYEVHLGSWKRRWNEDNRPLSYRELAVELADYVLEHGFTHVELMPVAEHPFTGSWGYQITGYYAPTHRYGDPNDFKFFVDYLHQKGIGVLLDWVPAHFPRDTFALPGFDGTCLYEHEDPRLGAHMDWGTLIFNYGRHEVRCFLVANALAWLERYHIDGLRVDAVASMLYLDYSRDEGQWIPNKYGGNENLEAIDFLKETNRLVHKYYPGVLMIAEESTSFSGVTKKPEDGGLGFDLKWNMGWMHDNMSYFEKDPIYRKHHQNNLTFGMLYQYAENFITVFSHDEVTHGKGSMLMKMGAGSIPEKSQNLRALYGHMWGYPGKKLLFMGSEFGQSEEWSYDRSLQWHLNDYIDHSGISALVRDLNALYRSEPALAFSDSDPQAFRWIACWDADASVISYVRSSPDGRSKIMVIGHFTPILRESYRIGLPAEGHWREVLNTDSEYYGGGNRGNVNGVNSEPGDYDGFSQSGRFVLPPLSTVIFKWEG